MFVHVVVVTLVSGGAYGDEVLGLTRSVASREEKSQDYFAYWRIGVLIILNVMFWNNCCKASFRGLLGVPG